MKNKVDGWIVIFLLCSAPQAFGAYSAGEYSVGQEIKIQSGACKGMTATVVKIQNGIAHLMAISESGAVHRIMTPCTSSLKDKANKTVDAGGRADGQTFQMSTDELKSISKPATRT